MGGGGVILHDIRFYRDSSGVQPAKEYIKKFVLLHAFPKKTQKTPQRENDQAIREVKDLREKGLRKE